MAHRVNRRGFLATSAALSAGYWAAGGVSVAKSDSPNEKIRFASVGVGGKGSSDSADAAKSGEMVAICDVDEKTLNNASRRYKNAAKFTDYRKMFDEMGDKFDAVTVSTPDHHHAIAAIAAMKLGKHCFCQKPLTHSIYEARMMGKVAREQKVATQMGNQGTSMKGVREAAAVLKTGALGRIKEVHVWTNRPIWPQGADRPESAPAPENVDWNVWLGPAPERPFANGYHPFAWRGWWDFGTGALGDMACHTFNMAFMGLDLRDPTAVSAKTSGHNRDSYPAWSIIEFDFPANDNRDALKAYWYDGGKRPPMELFQDDAHPKPLDLSPSGSIVVGEKGRLYSPHDYGEEFVMLGGVEKPDVDFATSPGHFQEWVRAIKGGEPAMSNFPDYAGPLTETILLGNLAVWANNEKWEEGSESKKIEWDAKNLKPTNAPDVAHVVKREYRDGWSI